MESVTINNELDEVVFLESVGGFTRKYCTHGREFLIEDELNHLEENLPNEKFFKINDSYIINADFLKRIKSNATKNVILHNGLYITDLYVWGGDTCTCKCTWWKPKQY